MEPHPPEAGFGSATLVGRRLRYAWPGPLGFYSIYGLNSSGELLWSRTHLKPASAPQPWLAGG